VRPEPARGELVEPYRAALLTNVCKFVRILRPSLRRGFGGQAERLLLSLAKGRDERDRIELQNMTENTSLTPLMRQFYTIKKQHADALLFFQVGDFYELFFDDAKTASAFLGIALTKRGKTADGEPIPLCGVPVHALDHYMNKLIRGGFKVALCDQLEAAVPGKMVERGVTRVMTPGTLTDSALLDEKSASYVVAFFPHEGSWGLLFCELLTAQLFGTVLPATIEKVLEAELIRFFPDEVLLPANAQGKQFQSYFKQQGYFTSFVDVIPDEQQVARGQWLQAFRPETRKHLDEHAALRLATETFYAYMRKTNEVALGSFNAIQWYEPEDFLLLDAATQRNLELVKNNQDGGRAHTLCAVLDGAVTPMGSRMIKKWIMRPLIKAEAIMQRHDVVQECIRDVALAQQLQKLLRPLSDLERVVGRIALRRAALNDYLHCAQALAQIPSIRALLMPKKQIPLIQVIIEHLSDFTQLSHLLIQALNDDSSQEWIIKKGFDAALDRMRDLIEQGNSALLALEQREQRATGIGSLKVRYTSAHGYYIEVTKAHFDAIPAHYIRRQTLVGRERFTTQELQTLEYELERARTEITQTEQQVFERVKQEVARSITALRKLAHALAHIDALLGFATVAYEHNYVRPTFTASRDIVIINGRHPVVERTIHHFIPNDTALTNEQSLWIITGPNMGGKSTYLRQVGLIAIMAQCGAFVPAQQAQLPLIDRVFTRIGAGDNLADGKSTFMVEMEETAAICTLATQKSLVILDEVGRGTSTFDGLAIAQAVVEYLYTTVQARCLFATHYHELTALESTFPGIVSYYAASKKTPKGIVFLYKMIRGIADGSFGVEVAKKAALPVAIIERAEAILATLAMAEEHRQPMKVLPASTITPDQQLVMNLEAQVRDQEKVLKQLKDIDYENLSPKQAFDALWQLKELLD
jgi:DNA mismatch repair protein MutS